MHPENSGWACWLSKLCARNKMFFRYTAENSARSIWESSRSARKASPEYFQEMKFSGESLVKTLQTLHLVHIPFSQAAFVGHFIFLLFDFSSFRSEMHDTSELSSGQWGEVEREPLFEPCESDLWRFGSRDEGDREPYSLYSNHYGAD